MGGPLLQVDHGVHVHLGVRQTSTCRGIKTTNISKLPSPTLLVESAVEHPLPENAQHLCLHSVVTSELLVGLLPKMQHLSKVQGRLPNLDSSPADQVIYVASLDTRNPVVLTVVPQLLLWKEEQD